MCRSTEVGRPTTDATTWRPILTPMRDPGGAADGVRSGAGAVVTFDEPLAGGRPEHEAVDASTARQRRRIILFLSRVVVTTLLCAVVPFRAQDAVWFGLVLAFGYLPLAAVIGAGEGSHRPSRVALALGVDISALTAFQLVVAEIAEAAVVALAFVGLHTWAYGRLAGVITTALVLAGQAVTVIVVESTIDGTTIITTAVMASLLAYVVDDQSTQESRATSGLRLVSDKAEAILAGIADAVVTTTAAGHVRTANPAAENVLGCTAIAARDQHCGQLIGLRDAARTFGCEDGCHLLAVHGGSTVELHRTGPNGQRQPLLASATPLVASNGEVVEIIHSFRDITSVKQADEAKTLFLATASHELKTPLTVIRGFAQMLRSAALDDHQHGEATVAIEARATQLAGIVDRLLMTSRIEAGNIELHPTICRIDDVLAQRTRELESATSRRVVRTLPLDLPLAWVDLDALTTVLDHLLENAVKYSPDGGAVHVEADSDPDVVRIRCIDTGVGMTEEQRRRCFDRFWQAEGTDVRRFGGTGIGLYIVKSLIEAMDGTIEVDSTPGQGTTFTVTLRQDPPTTRIPRPTAEDESAGGDASMINEFMRQVGMPVSPPGSSG